MTILNQIEPPFFALIAKNRLLHEARASSALAHPNICTIHEVGENEGELYIVMELVEGKSLAAMSAGARLAPESVLRYGVQIASALARAHDRGIVHRDLKTANIVITADGLNRGTCFSLTAILNGIKMLDSCTVGAQSPTKVKTETIGVCGARCD